MYSQYGEDDVVLKVVNSTSNTGRLLEIGAWDPIANSNSRALIEIGWDAVLIELSPAPMRKLLQEYGSNPHVTLIQAAVGVADNGTLVRFDMSDDGLSTNDAGNREKWARDGGFFGKMFVPTLTLEHLLCQLGGGYDFVSFDVEGGSVNLAIDYIIRLQQRPLVICVEHDDRLVELQQTLHDYYNSVHTNGTNVIMVRK